LQTAGAYLRAGGTRLRMGGEQMQTFRVRLRLVEGICKTLKRGLRTGGARCELVDYRLSYTRPNEIRILRRALGLHFLQCFFKNGLEKFVLLHFLQ
jgi:hypothetical protein